VDKPTPPAQFRVDYDDDPDSIIDKLVGALGEAGITVSVECDNLPHDGYNVYLVKKG
jgi:hypothetical protein